MKKFLVPVALVLALTTGGSAFAASQSATANFPRSQAQAYENYLYSRPDPFTADRATPNRSQANVASDTRLNAESQQASLARMQSQTPSGEAWRGSFSDLYGSD